MKFRRPVESPAERRVQVVSEGLKKVAMSNPPRPFSITMFQEVQEAPKRRVQHGVVLLLLFYEPFLLFLAK